MAAEKDQPRCTKRDPLAQHCFRQALATFMPCENIQNDNLGQPEQKNCCWSTVRAFRQQMFRHSAVTEQRHSYQNQERQQVLPTRCASKFANKVDLFHCSSSNPDHQFTEAFKEQPHLLVGVCFRYGWWHGGFKLRNLFHLPIVQFPVVGGIVVSWAFRNVDAKAHDGVWFLVV